MFDKYLINELVTSEQREAYAEPCESSKMELFCENS